MTSVTDHDDSPDAAASVDVVDAISTPDCRRSRRRQATRTALRPRRSPAENASERADSAGRSHDLYPLPRVMAVANQKGGVGKTTTTVNLGACLAELGLRTLIIDLDPQGNASTGLGIDNRGLETSMYHVIMHEAPLENCVEPAAVKNLFVAPASLDLAGTEIELVPGVQPREPTQTSDRRRQGRLRLHPHRLSALARSAHRQRPDRRHRGARPDPVRVLRAGGSRPTAAQRRPRAPQPQPDARPSARSCA